MPSYSSKIVCLFTGIVQLPGGIASNNRNLLLALQYLAEQKNQDLVVLSYLEDNDARPEFLSNNYSFKGYKGNRNAFIFDMLCYVRKQVVFIIDHVTLGLPLLPFIKIGLVKSVILAHGSEALDRIKQTSKWIFQYASLTLTNSTFTFNRMKKRGRKFNGFPCPLGLSPQFKTNKVIPPPLPQATLLTDTEGNKKVFGNQVLLIVGRMVASEREKGHIELINLLPKVVKRYPSVQLVCAGPGDDIPYLKELAIQNQVGHIVFFPGFITKELLGQLYHQCYAFVMPSQQEGFGLVYLEAMNYGKPCIGCYNDGAADIILPNKTGLLIQNQQDEQELLENIFFLLDNKKRAVTMGKAGFKHMHEQFTSTHAQDRYKKIISTILE